MISPNIFPVNLQASRESYYLLGKVLLIPSSENAVSDSPTDAREDVLKARKSREPAIAPAAVCAILSSFSGGYPQYAGVREIGGRSE